jgi:hypothetical protein
MIPNCECIPAIQLIHTYNHLQGLKYLLSQKSAKKISNFIFMLKYLLKNIKMENILLPSNQNCI